MLNKTNLGLVKLTKGRDFELNNESKGKVIRDEFLDLELRLNTCGLGMLGKSRGEMWPAFQQFHKTWKF